MRRRMAHATPVALTQVKPFCRGDVIKTAYDEIEQEAGYRPHIQE